LEEPCHGLTRSFDLLNATPHRCQVSSTQQPV
jgi:hypothetical protein